MRRPIGFVVFCASFVLPLRVRAADAPAAAGEKSAVPSKPAGPALSLPPEAPQASGIVALPSESAASAPAPSTGFKFDVSGYFRAPLRFSWGPPTTPDPSGKNSLQLRTPPLVPDADYNNWRYTNDLIGPWTELNFHYGNDRVQATVQIASYNLTDPGYRRLEAQLGINQAYVTLNFPEVAGSDARLTLIAGGFTNRYGAAGRYDAGKYETYLFGRTHVAGETLKLEYDLNEDWTFSLEHGFGAKLEAIPYLGAPTGPTSNQPWDPYPGPSAQESTFLQHGHLGALFQRELLIGLHYLHAFANDNERAGAYLGTPFGGRPSSEAPPRILVYGAELKLLSKHFGDGYLGYSHLSARNADYLSDAIEVLHSSGGYQLHDNYFGLPGRVERATGKIDSVLFQHVLSVSQLTHYPEAFWGQGPDLLVSVFGMFNKVSGAVDPNYNLKKLKLGAELTYLPFEWFGVGARYDRVQPNLDDRESTFSVVSPRLVLRTAFVTHEQVVVQYFHYFYGRNARTTGYPYNQQVGAAGLGADSNAAQIAATLWF